MIQTDLIDSQCCRMRTDGVLSPPLLQRSCGASHALESTEHPPSARLHWKSASATEDTHSLEAPAPRVLWVLSLSLSLTHTHSLSLSLCLSRSVSLSFSLSMFLSLSLSLTHTRMPPRTPASLPRLEHSNPRAMGEGVVWGAQRESYSLTTYWSESTVSSC